MARKVNAAQAKAKLSALVAEVAYGGQHIIIERRGKPLAALVNLKDLEHLEQDKPTSLRPRGSLALVGSWGEIGDEHLESLIKEIYIYREKETGRPVELEV